MFSCLPVPASRHSAFEAGFSRESAERFILGRVAVDWHSISLFEWDCSPSAAYHMWLTTPSLCSSSIFLPAFSSFLSGYLHHEKRQKLEAQMKRKMLRAEEALGLVSYSPQSLLTSNSGSFQKAKKGNLCCTQPFCFLLLLWRPWKCP